MIRTNPFKPDAPQYQRSVAVPIQPATADTRLLIQRALQVLERLYLPGYA